MPETSLSGLRTRTARSVLKSIEPRPSPSDDVKGSIVTTLKFP